MMGPIRTLDDLTDMVRRRARLLIRVSVLGCVFALLLGMSQKPIFHSTEVVQFTGPAVSGVTDMHLQLIKRRLMTRASLLGVIDAYNLYAEYPEMTPAEMVERLREAVHFAGGEVVGESMPSLSVTARMPIAVQAQQVAHELSLRMIALDETARIGKARGTLLFLAEQEGNLADELLALDARVLTMQRGTDVDVLARRMQKLRGELDMVSAQRAKAEIAYQRENEGLAGRLTVIDPAAIPEHPLANTRKKVAAVGCVMSVIAALALALLVELRHPVIRSARQMKRETGFGPVVSIPYLNTTPPKRTRLQRFLDWLDGPETSDGPA